jgi:hypothetical protein
MSRARAPHKTWADHPIVQVSHGNGPALVILLPPQAFLPDPHQWPFWLEGPRPVVPQALHAAHDGPHAKGRSRSTPKELHGRVGGHGPGSDCSDDPSGRDQHLATAHLAARADRCAPIEMSEATEAQIRRNHGE